MLLLIRLRRNNLSKAAPAAMSEEIHNKVVLPIFKAIH